MECSFGSDNSGFGIGVVGIAGIEAGFVVGSWVGSTGSLVEVEVLQQHTEQV